MRASPFLPLGLFEFEPLEPRTFLSAAYVVEDLGPNVWPADINNRGQIVGSWDAVDQPYTSSPQRAFLLTNGKLRDLGVLASDSQGLTEARALNDKGQVVGCSNGRPFLYSEGAMSEIEIDSDSDTCAIDINENGEILLATNDHPSWDSAYGLIVFDGTRYTRVGVGEPYEMTNRGIVLADMWEREGDAGYEVMPYRAMNDRGGYVEHDYDSVSISVGDSAIEHIYDKPRAFRGGFEVTDMSNSGMVIGHVFRPSPWSDFPVHVSNAFIMDGAVLRDLNSLLPEDSGWLPDDPGWHLTKATAINDHGQIVGSGYYKRQQHGFLLTPIPGARFPDELSPMDLRLKFVWSHKRDEPSDDDEPADEEDEATGDEKKDRAERDADESRDEDPADDVDDGAGFGFSFEDENDPFDSLDLADEEGAWNEEDQLDWEPQDLLA